MPWIDNRQAIESRPPWNDLPGHLPNGGGCQAASMTHNSELPIVRGVSHLAHPTAVGC